jgi:glycosyltransferase involved in cell wall biosynthesis
MVVLQVLPALVSGGVERGTIEIVQAITAAGGVALVASSGGRLVPAVERAGGEHITLPLQTKDPVSMWRNAGKLRRLIEARGVEIVHARSRAPAWSAYWAARRAGVHFLTTHHGAYDEALPFKRRYNSVMVKGELVIAISGYIAQLIVDRYRLDPARIRLVPRGVDPVLFDPETVSGARMSRCAEAWRLPDGMRVVMLPARMTRWKGHEVLLRALTRIPERDVCAVLVGGGARRGYDRALSKLAQELGLGERVRIVGHCDDMAAAMKLADVVVHASTEAEAFGRVVIEAQAMGRPVIASDLGGPVETVAEGITGWRVPPGEVDALAAAISRALSLPEDQLAALGANARAHVLAHYTTAAMQQATLAVYDELIQGQREVVEHVLDPEIV